MKFFPYNDSQKISDLKDMLNKSYINYKEKTSFLIKTSESSEYIPVTYSKFKHDVDSLGTTLVSLGLKGKKIAILSENRYEWAVSYLAIVNGTGIVVPIDREAPRNEIENLLTRAEASCIIFSKKFESFIEELSTKNPNLEILINMDKDANSALTKSFSELVNYGKSEIENGNTSFLDATIDPDEMAMLLFTSGTTEQSKAVMLSHKNICTNIQDMSKMIIVKPSDIFLSFLPLHHTYECSCGFLFPIYRGVTIAYCEGLRHILKNLSESKATIMLSVPLIFENMYSRIWKQAEKSPLLLFKLKVALVINKFLKTIFKLDLSKTLFKKIHNTVGKDIRLFISGGAGIDPKVSRGFEDFGFLFLQGYGLTECSPILAVNRDVNYKSSSAGLVMPSVDVKIDDPNKDGVGEIIAKGESVMIGYYNNPEATTKVLKDEWFYTGDLGYFDKEGFLYITGRKKNVIVTKNGKNIYPEEIEMILNRSSYIKESLVWGSPDDDGDISLNATIVYDKEYLEQNSENISEEQIQKTIEQVVKEINKKLPLYKHIKNTIIREEEMIKTTTKKIKRQLELKS